MKNFGLLPAVLLFLSATVSAQVGVNTTAPNTTLDVRAKRDSGGNITDNTQLIGLQAPRLTRAELTANTATYGANQQGALIYITDVSGGTAAGQRINIDAVGYYSFDGSLWQKIKVNDINIYNNDGTLSSNRTLTQAGKTLTFLGTNQQTKWYDFGMTQTGLTSSALGEGSIGVIGADKNADGVSSRLWFQSFPDNYSQILADTGSASLNIGTHITQVSAPITFQTSAGSGALGTEKMRITGNGNIGINATSPTEKLDVNGIARLRNLPLDGATNAIYTQSNGTASATQNQTFTATKTLVADANGVLGSVNGVAAPPIVLAGGDVADATSGSFTISSTNNNLTEQILTTRNFTLAKKSLVTVSYSVGVSDVLRSNGGFLTDGNAKLIGTRLSWASLPAGSPFTVGNVISRSSVPYTQSGSNSMTGFFFLNGSRTVILDPGAYSINLIGYVAAFDNVQGVQATFGPGAADQFDIIAVPVP